MENENKIPTKIFALGGIEEIGKNMYVVEHDNEIWIVDCGIKFVDKNVYLGFGSIIPPFTYLKANQARIQGLLITHAHEDHIGGIPYLLKEVSIPKIYGGKLTRAIVENKLAQFKGLNKYEWGLIDDNTKISSKHFTIDFFRVCHSVPDDFGICFQTINGIICTTADFRFDFLTRGDETDIWKISEIGKRNVDVLLCESTNALQPGFSGSEKYVVDQIKKIFQAAPGRVFLTTFASMMGRIEEILEIAILSGRKVILGGRSMKSNVAAAIKIGTLSVDESCFIEMKDINNYPPEKIFVITTGSQGEENSGLQQMSTSNHPYVKFNQDDTVIFSSHPIPGNFESVEKVVNSLYKMGVHVFIDTPECKIHSSGHATQSEIQLMIRLLMPTYLIPIHGEFKMLAWQKRNGELMGIRKNNVIQISNGQFVQLLNHKAELTKESIEIPDVFVDGNQVSDNATNVLKFRQRLSSDGVVNITLIINRISRKVLEVPVVSIRGAFQSNTSNSLITKIAYSVKETIEQYMNELPQGRTIENGDIRKIAEKTAEYFIWRNKKKKPLIRVTSFDL
ncbi:MAG: ribonuclease J [Mycoplasmataceae bacterium]|nr:ribonuclease J [Mycoplasmataceae bacterium]